MIAALIVHFLVFGLWATAMADDSPLRSVVYYVDWAAYARQHYPGDLPVQYLSHVLYAFADVSPINGTVILTDSYADVEKRYDNDTGPDDGSNMYGAIKQLNLLKKHNRSLKVLLSIGGWTYSANFATAASSPEGRQEFARSATQLLQDHGFDGLDLDWEYPQDEAQAKNFVSLLQETRQALDTAAQENQQSRLLLTVACPAGASHYNLLQVEDMDHQVDFWNLMAYDYAGGFSYLAGHQSNLYSSAMNLSSTPFNTTAPLEYYTARGVPASKLVLGLPLYGRAFANTDGPGKPFTDVGKGDFEPGVWDFKSLPRPGSNIQHDAALGASWSYDPATRLLVSHEDVDNVNQKALFVRDAGLGGMMYWESSGDKAVGQGSLIEAFVNSCGGPCTLEQTPNELNYPISKYSNLRDGFPNE